ncbi:MAG: formate dehydrogenase accessory protein FdhE [Firmicutes bacterium]|nr:formate dehydrogenase accessory protein FdhE [Bacillota bacterium]
MKQETESELGRMFAEAADAARKRSTGRSILALPVEAYLDTVRAGLRRGMPVVLAAMPQVDPDEYAAAWRVMAEIIKRHQPASREALEQCQVALARMDGAETLVSGVLSNDTEIIWDWAAERGLDMRWLYLASELAARPFLHRLKDAFAPHLDFQVWRERYCPVCGRRPNVGAIYGENSKRLHCPGCGTMWPTRRYQCGLCGQDDEGALNFLVVEEWPGWRIETCRRCRGYLKVIDYREPGVWSSDPDLFVEDARTLILDAVAEERGYRKPELGGGMFH